MKQYKHGILYLYSVYTNGTSVRITWSLAVKISCLILHYIVIEFAYNEFTQNRFAIRIK